MSAFYPVQEPISWSGSGSGIVEAEFGYCFVEVVDEQVAAVVVVAVAVDEPVVVVAEVVDGQVAVVVDGNPDCHYC